MVAKFNLNLLLLLVWALVACAVPLASCSSRHELQVPKEIKVPTPVACVDAAKRPQKPALRTEDDLLAMDRYRRTLAAWSDLKKQEAYLAELEAVVEGCSRIPLKLGKR